MEGDGGVGGGAYLCFTGRVVSVGFTGGMGLKGFKRILLYFFEGNEFVICFYLVAILGNLASYGL